MFWATRTFSKDGWYYVQDQFEEEFEAAEGPPDTMLVYVELPDFRMQLFVGMPEPHLLELYSGFERCSRPAASNRPKLLMGDPARFDELFNPRRAQLLGAGERRARPGNSIE